MNFDPNMLLQIGQREPEVGKLLPPMPMLIGLTGPARSGKDTVGTMLKEEFDFQSVFFAEPLKEGARVMLGLNDDELYGDKKETTLLWLGKSPRQILQTLGTDWGRQLINNDIWLIVASRKIEALQDRGISVAITDVRFDNEAQLIRDSGGSVWHIQRSNRPAVNAHASELGVTFNKDKDFLITNDGSLEDLREIVRDTLHQTQYKV